jgi:NAD(P)-dependent dehydrogenase (short-subunit alcohol dehydrogenase family)
VVGGFCGIGRAIARWLANNGARYLILVSRNGSITDSSKKLLIDFERQNIDVLSDTCDIADVNQLKALLQTVKRKRMPPIRGVIQGAMVLRVSLRASRLSAY